MDQAFLFRGEALMSAPFYIWGIVNVTPDSFYDGGRHYSAEQAINQARTLWTQGAHILDVGGASSRPGAKDVPAEEEWQRIYPVIRGIQENKDDFGRISSEEGMLTSKENPKKGFESLEQEASFYATSPCHRPLISVDTWRYEVAEKALCQGVDIINDISAFSWEEKIADLVAEHKPGYALMHAKGRPQSMQDAPHYENVVEEVYAFFEHKMNVLVQKGLPEDHIILDLGIGFGKNLAHNMALLKNIHRFEALGRPILMALSYKSMFGSLLGIEKEDRHSITQVCTTLCAERGIKHHRVHDVLATVQSLTLQTMLA